MSHPDLVTRIRAWMFDDALPFWAERGVDKAHGGPVESLALDTLLPSGVAFKRTRVVCRQIYVYSHAELLGWTGARAVADHHYQYLTERVWQSDAAGFPRTVSAETAAPLDPTIDLYDHAFALFALGWRHKATKDPSALALAHRTLDLIEQRMRHPAGGFHHELPPGLPRQQNPHMHLMEAALVLAETSGEPRFTALADEIATLFVERLVRAPSGVLPEFFDEHWNPVDGDQGRWTEPGHQFEWAWILAQHQKLSGRDHVETVRMLVRAAERFGVDPATQVTFNGVRDDGVALDRGSRSWPNTERIKGWIGLEDLTGESADAPVTGSATVLLDRYLGAPWPKGAWMDAFDADGRPSAKLIPASTLYHVFLAFAEISRRAEASAN